METSDRMFFAFLGAVAAFFIFVQIWSEWKKRRAANLPRGLGDIVSSRVIRGDSGSEENLKAIARDAAASLPGSTTPEGTGFRFDHRGLKGRLVFISDKTEIQVDTADLVRQVVEIVPVGFPMSLFSGGKDRLRARGSKAEYDRIFKSRAEEQVLLEVGVAYDLRISPDGVTLRIHTLPGSAAVLTYWLACLFRILDLIAGGIADVEVTGVSNQVARETSCQVCGASLAGGAVVRCVTCHTPHHEDCWRYAGKCSTFGCSSQGHVR